MKNLTTSVYTFEDLLKGNCLYFDFEKELSQPVSELAFASYEIDKLETLPLLFQTGYLTIKNTTQIMERTRYFLDFPNKEVEAAFAVVEPVRLPILPNLPGVPAELKCDESDPGF